MNLAYLIEKLNFTILKGDIYTKITSLENDSRKVTNGSVFVCIKGAKVDGHNYIHDVIQKGAVAVIIEDDIDIKDEITIIKVDNTRKALAYMSAAYFGYPAEKLITIGITGTKGKTTTTYMVKAILEKAGIKTGLIGTIETIIGEEKFHAENTTPESYDVQRYFAKMVENGCKCVVMEVSSQGLMLDRVSGFIFDYGIFTNLEPDHIGVNEHKDFDDYARCKAMLFKQCKVGIVNKDDEHLNKILNGATCKIETYGFSKDADYIVNNMKLINKPSYIGVSYNITGRLNMEVQIDIPGKFSVYNSLTAIAICNHFGINKDNIIKALKDIKVKGRVEIVPISDKYTLMIDYAHNAMSLSSLLSTLREYNPKRLVCLFGCGGNRSKLRRYEMGEVSSRLADLTVVTSDNPRYEEPQAIINDIIIGVKKANGKYVEIVDRKEAIKYCIDNAQDGDVIVLAGKGHEDYQEIKGKKYRMDERELISDILEGR